MSRGLQVGRGAMYLYLENITTMFFGYAFWLLLSRMTSSDIVGISSSLFSFALIVVAVASIGVPLGIQRSLGKMFSEKRFEDAMVYVKSSFLLMSLGLTGSVFTILVGSYFFFDNFQFILVPILLILVAVSAISILLRHIIIASLNTKRVLFASIISSAAKLFVVVIMLLFGTGVAGVMIAFIVSPLITSILLAFDVNSILKQAKKRSLIKLGDSLRPLWKASVAGWIPLSIEVIGAQVGTIAVLGFHGPAQAGFYFIAFQISMGVLGVIWALEGTSYPALSSMETGRRRFMWRTIKVSMVILLPVSFAIMLYSLNIMQLFGYNYSEGSVSLKILMLSVIPNVIMNGIGILAYAYGNYRYVLTIGLASTIPRLLFYLILVPWFGGTGAALSYTLGTVFGLIASIVITKKIGMVIVWREIALMAAVPLLSAFLFSASGLHFILGILLSIVASYAIYLRLSLIDRIDVQDYLRILPTNIANPLIHVVDTIASKINRRY